MADILNFYVRDDRSVKYTITDPIMLEDNGVTNIRFRIPKVVNNIDMSGFAWWFVYVNAAGNKYSEPLTLTSDEDEPDIFMTATHTIDYGITIKAGNVRFALEAINPDTASTSGDIVNEWHTKTYNFIVQDTLQGNQAEYYETESDIISALIVQIQQKYNALVGGATPIPVASVSAMTDTSKIYLLTTDNNWYYHNGTTWVSGGQYASGIVIDPTLTQSGQAADAKVVGDEIEGVKSDLTSIETIPHNVVYTDQHANNLIKKHELIEGYYINTSGGVSQSASWNCTDFIDISAYSKICMSGNPGNSAFYDENKNFISTVSSNQTNYSVPEGAYYMRLSVAPANVDAVMLNGGSTVLPYDDGYYVLDIDTIESDILKSLKFLGLLMSDTYSTLLSDANNAKTIGYYLLHFSSGATGIPANLPFASFYGAMHIFIVYKTTGNYIRHLYYALDGNNSKIYTRYTINGGTSWHDWELVTDNKKKGYESGFIHFTVPVNQYIVDNSDTSNQQIDNENSIINVDCILSLPSTYTPVGTPTKLIMMCHGAGRGVYGANTAYDARGDWRQIASYNNLVSAFNAAGYAVFDCNGYANTQQGCSFWGAQRGVEAWRKAYDYVVRNYNVEENFSIYAFSMGGCTALNLAFRNFPNIKCIALGSPVTTLDETAYEHAGAAFNAAYGITEYDHSAIIGNDPMANVVTLNNTDYCFKPIAPLKIWFGSTETWPAPSDAQRLVTALKNAGGKADIRICEGRGHGLSYGEVPYVISEIVMYFNRFNY